MRLFENPSFIRWIAAACAAVSLQFALAADVGTGAATAPAATAAISPAAILASGGSTIRILDRPIDSGRARIEAINNAQSEILVNYYALATNDRHGLMFLAALRRAARRGVKVRMLLDGYTNRFFSRSMLSVLEAEGIEVDFYNDLDLHLFVGQMEDALRSVQKDLKNAKTRLTKAAWEKMVSESGDDDPPGYASYLHGELKALYFTVKSRFKGIEWDKLTAKANWMDGARPIFNTMRRDHLKALVIDGKTLITGGRNIMGAYFGHLWAKWFKGPDGKPRDPKRDWHWVDRDIILQGPAAEDARNATIELMNSPNVKQRAAPPADQPIAEADPAMVPALNNVRVRRAELDLHERILDFWVRDMAKRGIDYQFPEVELKNVSYTQDVMTPGGKTIKTGKRLVQEILAAEHSFVLETPYLLLFPEVKAALVTALAKPNFHLTLIVPGKGINDARFMDTQVVNDTVFMHSLGAEIFFHTSTDPPHAKAFIRDGKVIGMMTFNVLKRSYALDLESVTIGESEPAAAQMLQVMMKDEKKLMTYDEYMANHDEREKRDREASPIGAATKACFINAVLFAARPFL